MKLNVTLLFALLFLAIQQPLSAQCNGFTYCTSAGINSGSEWVESFQMGSINNVSGDNGGYMDFTSLNTDITLGQTVPFTCTPGFSFGSFSEIFQIWIDFNSDGDFDDTGEQIFLSGQITAAVSGSFVVPITATPGTTTMRVTMSYFNSTTPCGTFTFGEVEDYCVNILAGNGCYQTPMTISDITDTGALASWLEITDAESYTVRYREVGTATWTEVSTTNTSIALNLQGCSVYEVQIETLCGGGLSSGFSFSTEFLTFGCGNCLDFVYCPILNANTFNSYINNVTLNTMNSTTGDDAGYGDYTGPFTTSLEQGLTYNLISTVINDGYAYDQWYTAYIDFNADGDFDDPFERIMDSGESITDLTFSQSFPVPPTAIVGTTRLRVIVQNFNFNDMPTEPCVSFLNGEVEDYCIEITQGSGCYLPLETAVLQNLGESLIIGWEDGLVAESFSIQYREVGTAAWTEIDGITGNMYELGGLEECTDYEFQIKTKCVGTSTIWSNSIFVKTFGCGACFDFTYCPSEASNSNDDHIGSVVFGTLNNVSGNNGGYINFEDQFGLVIRPDSTYDLILTPEWPGFMFNVAWRVHIDYNADGDFDDVNEMVFEAPSSTNIQTTTVTVPPASDVVFGLTKMRISMREGVMAGPCDNWTFGEVEDYCVTILPEVLPCLFPQNMDTTNVTTNSVKMVWDMDFYEAAIGYIIRFKEVAQTDWMEFSTNIPEYQAFDLELCTDYEFQVRSVCPQDFSEYTESFVYQTACFSATDDLANAQNINALNVYPNPFTDRISLNFELKNSSNITIKLLNLNGQLLQIQELNNLSDGEHRAEIAASDLTAGMYLIQLSTEEEVVIRKVVKN